MPRELARARQRDPQVTVQATSGVQQRIAQRGATRVHTAKRSARYLDALASLDTHGTVTQPNREALHAMLAEEFSPPDVSIPLGCAATCYLGPPYQVHILDFAAARILEHFTTGQAMPEPFESARRLAIHPAYRHVEVYSDRLACVLADGSVSTVDLRAGGR